jgi:hypothetical protein
MPAWWRAWTSRNDAVSIAVRRDGRAAACWPARGRVPRRSFRAGCWPPRREKKPDKGFCTIETRPLSFGTYDPEASAGVDAVAQVIYTCDNQAKKIRIEMTTGFANQFDPLYDGRPGSSELQHLPRLDAPHDMGQGLYGTDVYYENNPPNGTPVIVLAYGRIPPRQDPPPGQYFDAVTVRVSSD